MNEGTALALSFVAGIVIGSLFFGGLWLTVRRLGRNSPAGKRLSGGSQPGARQSEARRPGLLFLASFAARIGVSVFAFYWIGRWWDWYGLLAALVGFLIPRIILTRRYGKYRETERR
jgi:F1F0 ATPase subunit 2